MLRCGYGEHDVEAVWVSSSSLECTIPPSAVGSHALLSVLSHNKTGYSNGEYLTFYDREAVPTVRTVSPPFGALDADASYGYQLHGANFAPTGGLRCRYGFDEVSGVTQAQFVGPGTIACQRPAFPVPADVPVVASYDFGANFSTTAARFTYYNDTGPPSLSSLAPILGPVDGGTRLVLSGANFAPSDGTLPERDPLAMRPLPPIRMPRFHDDR